MFASPTDEWINSTTVAYFTKVSILYVMLGNCNPGLERILLQVYNTSQSSRALGWNTNNYKADHYRYVIPVTTESDCLWHTVCNSGCIYLCFNTVVVETSHR